MMKNQSLCHNASASVPVVPGVVCRSSSAGKRLRERQSIRSCQSFQCQSLARRCSKPWAFVLRFSSRSCFVLVLGVGNKTCVHLQGRLFDMRSFKRRVLIGIYLINLLLFYCCGIPEAIKLNCLCVDRSVSWLC